MNHAYKLIWNTTLNLWQCASEITRSRGKSGSTKGLVDQKVTPPPIALNRTSKRLRTISLILATLFPLPLWAACTDGADYTVSSDAGTTTYTFTRDCKGDNEAPVLSLSSDTTINAENRTITGGTKPEDANPWFNEEVGGGNAIQVSGGTIRITGNLQGGKGQGIWSGVIGNIGGSALVISAGSVQLTGNLKGGTGGDCTRLYCRLGEGGRGGTALVMTGGSLTINGNIWRGDGGANGYTGSAMSLNNSQVTVQGNIEGSINATNSSITLKSDSSFREGDVFIDGGSFTSEGNTSIDTNLVLNNGGSFTLNAGDTFTGNLVVNTDTTFTANEGSTLNFNVLTVKDGGNFIQSTSNPVTIRGHIDLTDTDFTLKKGSRATDNRNLSVNGKTFTIEDGVELTFNDITLANTTFTNPNPIIINGNINLTNTAFILKNVDTWAINKNLSVDGKTFTIENDVNGLTFNDLTLANTIFTNPNPVTINGNINLTNTDFALKNVDTWANNKNLTLNGGSFTNEAGNPLTVNNLTLVNNPTVTNMRPLTINGDIDLTNTDFTLKNVDTWATNKNLSVNGGTFTIENGVNGLTFNDLTLIDTTFTTPNTIVADYIHLINTNFTLKEGSQIKDRIVSNGGQVHLSGNLTRTNQKGEFHWDEQTPFIDLTNASGSTIAGTITGYSAGNHQESRPAIQLTDSDNVVIKATIHAGDGKEYADGPNRYGSKGNDGLNIIHSSAIQFSGSINAGNGGSAWHRLGLGGHGIILDQSQITIDGLIQAGNSGNNPRSDRNRTYGDGGSGVLLKNGSTLVIGKPSTIIGGKRATGYNIQPNVVDGSALKFEGSGNTLELHTSSNNITLSSPRDDIIYGDSTENTLVLGGDDNNETFDLNLLGTGKLYDVFNTVNKTGSGIWTLSNNFEGERGITAINLNQGTLALDNTAQMNASLTLKVAANTILGLDKEAVIGDNVVLDLADSFTLKTNAPTLDAAGAAGWWDKVFTQIGDKSNINLYTVGTFDANTDDDAHNIAVFKSWRVGENSTADSLDSLGASTHIDADKSLTINNFDINALGDKTIDGEGTVKLGGELDLSNQTVDKWSKISAQAALTKTSRLVTSDSNLQSLNKLATALNFSDKENATVKTTAENFAANNSDSKVSDFSTWEVGGTGSTVTGADLGKNTKVLEGGGLTVTNLTLGANDDEQTIINTAGGTLTLAGEVNLDKGVLKTTADDNTSFAANTTLTTEASDTEAVTALANKIAHIANKSGATLITSHAVDAGHLADGFGSWNINGAGNTTATALADENTIASGANLIANVDEITTGQSITNNGTLTLGGKDTEVNGIISAGESDTNKLVKTGSDTTVTINSANNFSAVNINAGTLKLTDDGSLNSGATSNTLDVVVAQDAALEMNVTDSPRTLDFQVSGKGGLTKSGAGTLVVVGEAKHYEGTTDVQAGTLQIGQDESTTGAIGKGNLNIANGAQVNVKKGSSFVLNDNSTLQIDGTGVLSFEAGSRLEMNSTLSKMGKFSDANVQGLDQATLFSRKDVQASDFDTVKRMGTWEIETDIDLPQSLNGFDNYGDVLDTIVVTKDSKAYLDQGNALEVGAGKTLTINGKFDNAGDITNQGILTIGEVGNADAQWTNSGTLTLADGSAMTVNGVLNNSGTLTLGTGANTTIAGTVVNSHVTTFGAGSSAVFNGTLENSGTLSLDKDANFTKGNNATLTFKQGSVLETNASNDNTALTTLLGAITDTDKMNTTLLTTGTADDSFNGSEETAKFGTWQVGSTTTVDRNEYLSHNTEVLANAKLTANSLTLNGKELKNTDGALVFTGDTNLDNGVLKLLGGTTRFDDGAILTTEKASGTALLGNPESINKIANSDKAILSTEGTSFDANDGFAAKFGAWEVASKDSQVSGEDNLANITKVVKDGELTVTDLQLENKTLENTGGQLTFAGNINLDNGTVNLSGGTTSFGTAVLTTAAESGTALLGKNSLLSTIEASNTATLRTTGAFKADDGSASTEGFVTKFDKWQVAGQDSTADGIANLANTTEVLDNGKLTVTGLTLVDKHLKNSGGKLVFAGETNLDNGTLEASSGVIQFASDVILSTAKGSGSEIQNGLIASDKVGGKEAVTLRTTGSFTANDGFTHQFKHWAIAGDALAVGAENLALSDTLVEGVLEAADLALGAEQSLTTKGDAMLILSGTTNLDKGTLNLAKETANFSSAPGTVLETEQTSGDALFARVADIGLKDQITLHSLKAIAANKLAGEFKQWEVKGAGENTASALAIEKTTIDAGAKLTTDVAAIKSTQRVENNGELQLTALTRLLANTITGTGNVIKQGANTLTYATGAHTYTGNTEVATGTLALEKGVGMSGAVHVQSGATLGLSLVESEQVNAQPSTTPQPRFRALLRAAEPAPVTAPQPLVLPAGVTQQVAGLTVDNGGTVSVVVNGLDNHSHLHSTGDITLAPDSRLVINAADYVDNAGTVENVFTTDTQINGQFGQYEDNSALFLFKPEYSAKAIHLAVSPNVKVEQIVEAAGDNLVVPIAKILDQAFTKDAESALARRFYALQMNGQVARTVVDMQPLLAGTGNRVLAEASDLMQRYVPTDRCSAGEGDRSAWVHGLGNWSMQKGDKGLSGYKASHYGIALGGDVCVNNSTKVGLSAAYVNTKANERSTSASQTLKADTWQVGVYANHALNQRVDVDAQVAVGRANIKGKRQLSQFGLTAKGDTHAGILRTGVGLNLHYAVGNTALIPYARVDYTQVNTKGYTEKGAEEFNLKVDKQRTQALMAGVGLKVKHTVKDSLNLNAKLGVVYDMLHKGNGVTAALTSLPGQAFTVKNTKLGRTVGEVGLGVGYQVSKSTSLSADVQALFGKGRTDTSAQLGVKVSF